MSAESIQLSKNIQTKLNAPLDARQSISSISNIYDIIYPYIGMNFQCQDTLKKYKVLTLKDGYLSYTTQEITPDPVGDVWVDCEPVSNYFVGTYEEETSGGSDGKSAYQIWLDLGNTGTEQDFINSLKGEDGKSAYEIWLEAGNTGSLDDYETIVANGATWGNI